MTEKQDLNYLQRYLVEEAVEDLQEGQLTRRQALKMIAGVMGSMAAANAFLAACVPAPPPTPGAAPAAATLPPPSAAATVVAEASPTVAAEATRVATEAVIATTATVPATPPPTPAPGVRVDPDDPDIEAMDVQFPGQGTELMGYLARPAGDGSFPPVLVCHENRGLTDHIKDVARRVAKAGYVGLAVDLLSRQGGTAAVADADSIPGLLGNAPAEQHVQDFRDGLTYLQSLDYVMGDRPGMVGFCFGGGITWLCATQIQELRAAVPFYGPIPPLEAVPNIQAAVLAIYGGNDERINAGIPAIQEAMEENNKVFEMIVYPDANHAFHNDTGRNYKPDAAMDAWAQTIAWFDQHLKGQ